MAVRNPQATYSSVAMAMPRGSGFRTVADHHAVNQLIKHAAIPMKHLEELGLVLEGVAAFCNLDIIQGHWQTPLHTSVEGLFTMVSFASGALQAHEGAAGSSRRNSVLPGDHSGCARWCDQASMSSVGG